MKIIPQDSAFIILVEPGDPLKPERSIRPNLDPDGPPYSVVEFARAYDGPGGRLHVTQRAMKEYRGSVFDLAEALGLHGEFVSDLFDERMRGVPHIFDTAN